TGHATVRPPPNRSLDGAHLYRSQCAPCHGPEGRGDGPDADAFSPPPRNLREGFLGRYDDATLVRRILDGMPLGLVLDPRALRVHTDDVEAIVAHMERLPKVDWRLAERGEEIYVDRCELCHGPYGGSSGPPGRHRPPDLSTSGRSDKELLRAL